ncbi:Transposase IS66 family protein [Gemmata sp. SH-PL17]|uniref:hypothetical protein n=1 Tax=Gemmata sp. SH-PL17 TaxID=1630693 RepID=UPI00078EE1C2|nr:Transposase IS66 family protein [Gemmata sp. SH-PL17]
MVGKDLLTYADVLLAQWKRVRDGARTRRGFRQSYLGWLRTGMRGFFKRGIESVGAVTAGVCRELRVIEPARYTFVAVSGVEPTNRAAERALRHAVCWRNTSSGTDSAAGHRFVERVRTVVATGRQQQRGVLEFLSGCARAAVDDLVRVARLYALVATMYCPDAPGGRA